MKLFRMSISLLCIAATALCSSGCAAQTASSGQSDIPVYTPVPAPAITTTPKVAAKPAGQPSACTPNGFTLKSDLLQLQKQVPARAAVGQSVENTITINVLDNCADVVITDTIPEGATYVKSEPVATVIGRKLTWTMDTLDKGSQIIIKVWYKADQEGCLVNCSTMNAIPRGCARTLVGSAKLVVTCQLPAKTMIGSALNETIEVTNVGTVPANDVIITDTLSDGLSSASGQTLTFDVGELAPGQPKQIAVPLKAAKRGQAGSSILVKSSNATEATAQCAAVVNQPSIDVANSGTAKQFLGRNASYDIVVSNTGDTDLQNIVVTDEVPAATKILTADGSKISGNTAVWTIDQMKSGAKQTLNIAVTSLVPGSQCNAVAVKTADGLNAHAQACTLWKGVPAILLETKGAPDPIGVGELVTYTIRVTNPGTAEDKNVNLFATFGNEIDPVSASNDGKINGKIVIFPLTPSLAAKQVVTYTITAKAIATGDHRLKVSLTSDMLTTHLTQEQSTHVY